MQSKTNGMDVLLDRVAPLALGVGLALLCWPVLADEAPAAESADPPLAAQRDDAPAKVGQQAQPAGIENIVITARKREENLQSTPLAVTAISGNTLEDAGAMRADEISNFSPSLLFDQSAARPSEARISIRGVTNTDPIVTRENSVGVYLDGIYLGRAAGQLVDLADMERVEVLRGPQGTLFGRNTIGGAINIISRKPTDKFEANGTVRVGNFNLIETRGAVNIPIVPERRALRIVFQTATRD